MVRASGGASAWMAAWRAGGEGAVGASLEEDHGEECRHRPGQHQRRGGQRPAEVAQHKGGAQRHPVHQPAHEGARRGRREAPGRRRARRAPPAPHPSGRRAAHPGPRSRASRRGPRAPGPSAAAAGRGDDEGRAGPWGDGGMGATRRSTQIRARRATPGDERPAGGHPEAVVDHPPIVPTASVGPSLNLPFPSSLGTRRSSAREWTPRRMVGRPIVEPPPCGQAMARRGELGARNGGGADGANRAEADARG